VSGSQGKNSVTNQACQAEAVNLSIAFVPRQNGPARSRKRRKPSGQVLLTEMKFLPPPKHILHRAIH
jgi:hypothetical protein